MRFCRQCVEFIWENCFSLQVLHLSLLYASVWSYEAMMWRMLQKTVFCLQHLKAVPMLSTHPQTLSVFSGHLPAVFTHEIKSILHRLCTSELAGWSSFYILAICFRYVSSHKQHLWIISLNNNCQTDRYCIMAEPAVNWGGSSIKIIAAQSSIKRLVIQNYSKHIQELQERKMCTSSQRRQSGEIMLKLI